MKITLSLETVKKNASVLMASDDAGGGGQLQRMAAQCPYQNAGANPQQRNMKARGSSPNGQQVKCFCCGKIGHVSKSDYMAVCNHCGKQNRIACVSISTALPLW